MKNFIGKKEFIENILSNLNIIKEEYLQYQGRKYAIRGYPGVNTLTSEPVTVDGWTGIPLWWDRRAIRGFQKKFLKTMSLQGLIEYPAHTSTGWLSLDPESEVKPHNHKYDKWRGKLLMHIPLILGKGSCGIQVGNNKHEWELYNPIVFDSEKDHCTWNNTNKERVNFVMDFSYEEWKSILKPYVVD